MSAVMKQSHGSPVVIYLNGEEVIIETQYDPYAPAHLAWSAFTSNYDLGSPLGLGLTANEAITELVEQLIDVQTLECANAGARSKPKCSSWLSMLSRYWQLPFMILAQKAKATARRLRLAFDR